MIVDYLNFLSKKKSQITIFILLNICGLIFFLLPHNIFSNMLDLRFSYNEEIVNHSFVSIGEDGRQLYFFSALIIDTIYPLLYVSLFLGAYYKLFNKNTSPLIFPLAAGFFDILENIQVSLLLTDFPTLSGIVPATGQLGLVKVILILISLLSFIFISYIKPKSYKLTGISGSITVFIHSITCSSLIFDDLFE